MKQPAVPIGTRVVDFKLAPRAFSLLCVTVACVLVAHIGSMPLWYTTTLLAILGLRWRQYLRHPGRVEWQWRGILLLLVIGTVTKTCGTLFGREADVSIVCAVLVLKLLESDSVRDARVAIGFSCILLMSALLFDQSLANTLAIGLMLLPALATLRALEPGVPTTQWSRAFVPGTLMLAASVPAALLGFLLIPRLTSPVWGTFDSGAASTGVSDEMTPGDLHGMLTNNAAAMRVRFDGALPPASQLYFRGMTLWNFDGHTWQPGAIMQYAAALPETVVTHAPVTSYEVTLLPNHQHWLFALDVPLTAAADIYMEPDRTLWINTPVDHPLRYRVVSATRYLLEPDRFDPHLREAALELPAGFDPRARTLAARWRAQAGGDEAEVVNDALRLFHDGGFTYDLDAPPLGRDSIDDFLFDTKSGFCEHYASAFTFLMRAAGIPARVVVGYQGGDWNAAAHYLLVRQSNAHAWSEVWIAQRGWVRVDPTAAVSKMLTTSNDGAAVNDTGGGGDWWLAWQNRLDFVNLWWSQSVVGFNAPRQSHLLRPLGVEQADTQTLGSGLAFAVLLTFFLGALLASLPPRRKPRDRLTTAQWRLQRKLARAGVTRGAAEGPRDFYQRCIARLPASANVLRELATEYLALRYAFPEPPPERMRAFRRRVRHFHPCRVVK